MEHHPFTWLSIFGSYEPLATAVFVMAALVGFAAFVHGRLARIEAALQPEDGMVPRSIAEVAVEIVSGLAESAIGQGYEKYVSLLLSFFVFILVGNLLGLVPGFVPPTSSFNITAALGLVSFVAYNVYGFRANGALGYLKHFAGPVLLLAPLMIVIELFGHAFRPVSLAVRLFANMFADHQLVEKITDLTWFVVPVAFYMLGTLVCVVQAAVFTMLSATYIALAVSHDH